jgi:hypothetical protein
MWVARPQEAAQRASQVSDRTGLPFYFTNPHKLQCEERKYNPKRSDTEEKKVLSKVKIE